MCELFAMSSRHPATVTLSLSEFARHGGDTGPHADGWGIAYYEGRDARLIREPESAASSRCAALIEGLGIASDLVLSHIRKATHGPVHLANTQPFSRELGGRLHLFAHNGELEGLGGVAGGRGAHGASSAAGPRGSHHADRGAQPGLALGRFRPLGDTDSEHAFCALLARLEPLWLAANEAPPLRARWEIVSRFAAHIRDLGRANFLYADGDALFAHGHVRRQVPGGPRVAPGLYTLCRTCQAEHASGDQLGLAASGVHIRSTRPEQRVLLVASVPLSDEAWSPAPSGEVLVVRGGARVTPPLFAAAR